MVLAFVALSATFLAPLTARRLSLYAPEDRTTHMVLNTPPSFEEGLGAQLADILAASRANGETMPAEPSPCCARSFPPRRARVAGL